MRVPKRKPGKHMGLEPDRFVTIEKLRSMESSFRRIVEVDLPEAAKDASIAKELGDFSENAAYSEAKSRLRRLQNRASSLKARIAHAIVITKGPATDGSVKIGSTVTVRVNGREKTYEILGSQEVNPSKGHISHLSPLGALLMGKKQGEHLILKRSKHEISYKIVKVE